MKIVLALLILALLLSAWLFPSTTPALGMGVVLLSLGIAVFVVLRKHRKAYLQGEITRTRFVRNVCLDILGILLAVTLAVLLARYLAGIVVSLVNGEAARLFAQIILGLLTGIGVGIVVSRFWSRFVKTSSES